MSKVALFLSCSPESDEAEVFGKERLEIVHHNHHFCQGNTFAGN
jgi:hypothetical protein